MGQRKLRLELIQNEKSRIRTFHARKKGLKKKASELSTLCNIKVCLIICDPSSADAPPETWPEDPAAVRATVDLYRSHIGDARPKLNSDLSGFFKKKIECRIAKRSEKIRKARFPTWDARIGSLAKESLGIVAENLSRKIESVRLRMERIRGDQRLREGGALTVMERPPQMPIQYYAPPLPSDLQRTHSYDSISPSSCMTLNPEEYPPLPFDLPPVQSYGPVSPFNPVSLDGGIVSTSALPATIGRAYYPLPPLLDLPRAQSYDPISGSGLGATSSLVTADDCNGYYVGPSPWDPIAADDFFFYDELMDPSHATPAEPFSIGEFGMGML